MNKIIPIQNNLNSSIISKNNNIYNNRKINNNSDNKNIKEKEDKNFNENKINNTNNNRMPVMDKNDFLFYFLQCQTFLKNQSHLLHL